MKWLKSVGVASLALASSQAFAHSDVFNHMHAEEGIFVMGAVAVALAVVWWVKKRS